jgi:hypothetical protein
MRTRNLKVVGWLWNVGLLLGAAGLTFGQVPANHIPVNVFGPMTVAEGEVAEICITNVTRTKGTVVIQFRDAADLSTHIVQAEAILLEPGKGACRDVSSQNGATSVVGMVSGSRSCQWCGLDHSYSTSASVQEDGRTKTVIPAQSLLCSEDICSSGLDR